MSGFISTRSVRFRHASLSLALAFRVFVLDGEAGGQPRRAGGPRGRHDLAAGTDWRQNFNDAELSAGRDGRYIFLDMTDFARDNPFELDITVDRFTGRALSENDYRRSYGQREFAFFFQDNLKLTRRLSLNLGLRYEYFGVPGRRDGPPDWNLFYGPGSNRVERLASAAFRRAAPYPDFRNKVGPAGLSP